MIRYCLIPVTWVPYTAAGPIMLEDSPCDKIDKEPTKPKELTKPNEPTKPKEPTVCPEGGRGRPLRRLRSKQPDSAGSNADQACPKLDSWSPSFTHTFCWRPQEGLRPMK